MTFVTTLLIATVAYAATFVQEWVGTEAPAGSLTNAACHAASTGPVKRGDVFVNVYNTTPREGLAAKVAKSVRGQGFKIGTVGNDPLALTVLGVGEIRHGPAGGAGAIHTSALLPGARVVQDNRPDASVDLVLGSSFAAVSRPPKGAAALTVMPPPCTAPRQGLNPPEN